MMENKNNGTVASTLKEAYEAKVGLEAFARAGRNPNLKGIVHEVLFKDAQTLNPANLMNGTKAILSNSTTATRDDVLFIQGSKIVGRAQLKDTAQSIGQTVRQVAAGNYQGTVLMGTKETVSAYNAEIGKAAEKGVRITQKMHSTGVSSADTARIAAKTIGGELTGKAIASAAKSSGAIGAAVAGGIEAIRAGKDLLDGEIDGKEFVSKVAKETGGGAFSATVGGITATVVTTSAATALSTISAPVWIPATLGIGAAAVVGSVAKGIWDSIWD